MKNEVHSTRNFMREFASGIPLPSAHASKNHADPSELPSRLPRFNILEGLEHALLFSVALEKELEFSPTSIPSGVASTGHAHGIDEIQLMLMIKYQDYQRDGWNFGKDFVPESAVERLMDDALVAVRRTKDRSPNPSLRQR